MTLIIEQQGSNEQVLTLKLQGSGSPTYGSVFRIQAELLTRDNRELPRSLCGTLLTRKYLD